MRIQKLAYHAGSLLILFCFCITCSGPNQGFEEPPPPLSDTPIAQLDINTRGLEIPKDPKIMSTLRVFINEELRLEQPMGIESIGIGEIEQGPKFSYGLESWTANGLDMDVSILSMPEEEDWILYGPYNDKTLIRHALMVDLTKALGRYGPRYDFVELTINDQYQGIYLFSEKIKRDTNRLNLVDLDPDENDASTISGGYILRVDDERGDRGERAIGDGIMYSEKDGFRSMYGPSGDSLPFPAHGQKRNKEHYFMYEDPDKEVITEQQKTYIQGYLAQFEDALLSDNFAQGERSYADFIAIDSFVDYILLSELSANPDAYRFHTYLYKDRNGPLNMGPIWMANLAFGHGELSKKSGWMFELNQRTPESEWLVHFWWERLLEDNTFRSALATRWAALRASELSNEAIMDRIDTHASRLNYAGALDRNVETWTILGKKLPSNTYVGSTYAEEIAYLKEWLTDRLVWMDAELSGSF